MHVPPALQPFLPSATANRDDTWHGRVMCCFHPTPRLQQGPSVAQQRDAEHQVPTLRLRCAGSDLQSRSMCSPTTTSGISPRLTGTGVLQRGHTGTCTSCRDKKRGLGASSWAALSAVQTSLSLSGSACHGLHSITCGWRPHSSPAGVPGTASHSGKGGQQGWETPKPRYPVA